MPVSARRGIRWALVLAVVLLAAGCSSSEPGSASPSPGAGAPPAVTAVVTTPPPPVTSEPPSVPSTPPAAPSTASCAPTTSLALVQCDDNDPRDNFVHLGSCMELDVAQNSYTERPCAGATVYIDELTTGPHGTCFGSDSRGYIPSTPEELAEFPGIIPAIAGSHWCLSPI